MANTDYTVPAFNLCNLTALVSDGKTFTIEFIKRTTGELRTMNCRLGVKKFLRGGKMAYSPAEKQLLTVFDMQAKAHCTVPLKGIQRISVGGQTFHFGDVA